ARVEPRKRLLASGLAKSQDNRKSQRRVDETLSLDRSRSVPSTPTRRDEPSHHDGRAGSERSKWNRREFVMLVIPARSASKVYTCSHCGLVCFHLIASINASYSFPLPSINALRVDSPVTDNVMQRRSLGRHPGTRSAHSTMHTPLPSKYSCVPKSANSPSDFR